MKLTRKTLSAIMALAAIGGVSCGLRIKPSELASTIGDFAETFGVGSLVEELKESLILHKKERPMHQNWDEFESAAWKCDDSKMNCFYVTRPISYERCLALNKLPFLKSPAVTNENLKPMAVMAGIPFWAFDVNTVKFECVKLYAGDTYVVPAVLGEKHACLLALEVEADFSEKEEVEELHHLRQLAEIIKGIIHTICERLEGWLDLIAAESKEEVAEVIKILEKYGFEVLSWVEKMQSLVAGLDVGAEAQDFAGIVKKLAQHIEAQCGDMLLIECIKNKL